MALEHWLWLSALQNVRPSARCAALRQLGSPEAVAQASEQMLAAVPGVRPAEARHLSGSFDADAARQLLARCRSEEIEIITLQDARYPRRLLYTDDAPVVLYVRGQLPEMDRFAAVGVVGTRSASPAALGTARQLGGELAACGALVVSGLSAGIDTAAAEGALAMQGAVVGVLGTAIDAPHPRHGAQLFSQICGSGALISELPPGYAARRWDIAARSRIISGLSVGVLVVEAPEQSGALHAAHAAEAQGRMIFAVPGSAGTDGLLREQAHSALCGWDVMAPFSVRFSSTVRRPTGEIIVPPPAPPPPKPAAPKRAAPKPSAPRTAASAPAASGVRPLPDTLPENRRKLAQLLQEGSLHVDELISRSGLPASVVLAELTMLQIGGYVRQEQGKHFRLTEA